MPQRQNLKLLGRFSRDEDIEMKGQLTSTGTLCFVVAVGLALSACKKQDVAPDVADLAGTYTLVSVDGEPVPTSVDHEGATLEVRSGSLKINADGTCSSKTVFVPPSGAEVAREVTATYTKDGPRLTIQWKGAGRTVGTIQGKTFTMNNEGMVFVYKKVD